jgi:hypothetical protein
MELYNKALKFIAIKKNKLELIKLDHWKRVTFPLTVKKKGYISKKDMSKILDWKLIRGKMRPLKKLFENNSSEDCKKASKLCLQLLSEKKYIEALVSLTTLKGIGIATSSAILSSLVPNELPFMSDEVIECVTENKKYTLKVYLNVRDYLKELAKKYDNDFTAESVGMLLWSMKTLKLN